GAAQQWATAERKVEAVETIQANGYKVRKYRFEILPSLWVPGLVYEPDNLSGKVPAVLNVMGHEKEGISTPYIQERCINLAKRGILAVNVEWLGRGQLSWDDYSHYKMNQLDLTGTSGLAPFYLHLERTLDLVLRHPNADPQRIAVTGLSGGGWQTTFLAALDTRIKLAMPSAGHSSFVTRAQWPTMDLGDSEQTPSDMATVADYLHMSALTAPRPLLLVNNAKDNCCFRADYAMGPVLQATRHVYSLYGAQDKLRYFINHADGHNYNQDTREELYAFLKDEFKGTWDTKEIPVLNEVRKPEQLAVPIPKENETFQSLARKLAASLPRAEGTREDLAAVVKAQQLDVDAREAARANGAIETTWWRLRLGRAWTVPAVELARPGAKETVILIGDEGRASLAEKAQAHLAQGRRVLAVDPFYTGESKIATRDWLFAILIAALGERPLGLQASQLTAIARWQQQRTASPVTLEAHGRRASLMALTAAALEPAAIRATHLNGSIRSLKRIIDEDVAADKWPEAFCFGLLEKFDIPQLARLGNNVTVR
ncbi:MAG: prolyl oligopeptidase family serine peptidase, partial [Bryobacterales bacterium]|nr:prolyl oligopeptidase family serine peptidase [Bryobacterales bacterium]